MRRARCCARGRRHSRQVALPAQGDPGRDRADPRHHRDGDLGRPVEGSCPHPRRSRQARHSRHQDHDGVAQAQRLLKRDRRWCIEMNAKAAAQDVTKPESSWRLLEVRAKGVRDAAIKSTINCCRPRTACSIARSTFSRSTTTSWVEVDLRLPRNASPGGRGRHHQRPGDLEQKPVQVAVFTQDATLNADSLEVENSGEIVRFIGSVVMNLQKLSDPKQPAVKP